MDKLYEKIAQKIKKGETDVRLYEAAFSLIVENGDECREESKDLLRWVSMAVQSTTGSELAKFYDLYKRVLLYRAPWDFDSFMQYIEWDREPGKKFYLPRRKALRPVVDSLQDLADDKIDLLAISLPPGTGKTTTAIFFLSWLGGREPNRPILGGSHSNSFLRGVYDEVCRVIGGNGGEYLWQDVFPAVRIASTNAKDMRLDLDKNQRFETFEFSSIGSGNAGKVRAETLLYCDDLVDGIETALSKERLDKLWQQYTTDLRQRKIGSCKELHIATRWSVHDIIGRLEQQYEGNPRARFLVFPAMNEQDESNFDYPCDAGFSTAFYREQREIMDDASWRALYMNEPIEREGLLYEEDELRRYFDLPDREPDAIVGICDTKDKGTDYAFLPVAYQYGQDYYIADCICDNSNPDIVEARLADILLRNKVHHCRFESNSAGGRIARDVQETVKRRGGISQITTKYTTANKETKIIVNAAFVKNRFLFKDKSLYTAKSDYGRMMKFLCSYTMAGKNKHDDVPDGMAMLAEFVQGFAVGKVEVFQRPF